MVDAKLSEGLVNGLGCDLHFGEDLPQSFESFLGPPEFLLGGRSEEFLELLKPVTSGVVQVLLAEYAACPFVHNRKGLAKIGESF